MAHLQYKQKNIIHAKHKMDSFTARNKKYNYLDVWHALDFLRPELGVEDFIKDYSALVAFIGPDDIPVCTSTLASELVVSRFTQDKESFLSFVLQVQAVNEKLKNLQEKIKKLEDKSGLSKGYVEGITYRAKNIRSHTGYRTQQSYGVYQIELKSERLLFQLDTKQKEQVKPYEWPMSALTEAKLGLLTLPDLVELTKSKNPLSKLMSSELYCATEQDLNFERDTDIKIQDIELYYLAQENPKLVPAFRWVKVSGHGRQTSISLVTAMSEATPLNAEQMHHVSYMCRNENFTVCKFKAKIEGVMMNTNPLSQKIESVIEKDKIFQTLSATATSEKKTYKI